jgi:hypothetical protein
LGWSGTDLAKKSGIGITTLRLYELQMGIPSANMNVLLALIDTLEQARIEFTGDPLANPGVALNLKG